MTRKDSPQPGTLPPRELKLDELKLAGGGTNNLRQIGLALHNCHD